IEDVFAARVGFQVAGYDPRDFAVALGDQVLRLPAGARRGRAGGFERSKKGVRYERVVWNDFAIRMRIGAAIPAVCRDSVDGRNDRDLQFVHHCLVVYGLKPSKIIWSA